MLRRAESGESIVIPSGYTVVGLAERRFRKGNGLVEHW
jgi:hypothetical protein